MSGVEYTSAPRICVVCGKQFWRTNAAYLSGSDSYRQTWTPADTCEGHGGHFEYEVRGDPMRGWSLNSSAGETITVSRPVAPSAPKEGCGVKRRRVAPCRNCPHPYEAHHDYLYAGSMLCWKKPEWVDRMEGYQACNCPGYQVGYEKLVDHLGARLGVRG